MAKPNIQGPESVGGAYDATGELAVKTVVLYWLNANNYVFDFISFIYKISINILYIHSLLICTDNTTNTYMKDKLSPKE